MPLYAEILKRKLKKNEQYSIFLDDTRHPHYVPWLPMCADYPIKIARSYNDFVELITNFGLPQFISFDHDLADEHYSIGALTNYTEFDYTKIKEKTGMCCAKWLVDYCIDKKLKLPKWQSHSKNPCGCENIDGLLNSFKEHQEKCGI